MVNFNPIDLWACVSAAIAAGALATRANMLKPHQEVWARAPWPVWVAMTGLALGLAMAAVSIGGGAHATAREAMVYTLIAVAAVVMLWNLNRHGRANDLLSRLHGKAGLIQTIETRDPEAIEIFARAAQRRRNGNG